MPYHLFAISIGLQCIYVEREEDIADAWERALAADRPVLIEFKTDRRPATIMNRVAKSYSEEQIAAIADYLAALK